MLRGITGNALEPPAGCGLELRRPFYLSRAYGKGRDASRSAAWWRQRVGRPMSDTEGLAFQASSPWIRVFMNKAFPRTGGSELLAVHHGVRRRSIQA